MIPSWLRLQHNNKKVLTEEQRAILKALADPVDNKKVLSDEQWKNQVEEWYGLK